MGMLMPLDLKKDEKTTPVWKYELDVNVGFTWKSAGFSQFNKGFNEMLEVAKEKLLEQFKSSEFEDQYRTLR